MDQQRRTQQRSSVLIATLPLQYEKGVASHTRQVVRILKKHGYDVSLVWYQPYSMSPELSVPSWRLGRGRVRSRMRAEDGTTVHEVGCWLPELEFTNYWLTREWQQLIDNHDILLAVSGNPLAAVPLTLARRPFLAWLGTPFMPDRHVRVRQYPLPRRMLDRVLNARVCSHYERLVLNSGAILPTTTYVYSEFKKLAPRGNIQQPLPIPIDTAWFSPPPEFFANYEITFVGKYNDPRKNILLLLDVVRLCRESGLPAVLNLCGAEPSDTVRNYIAKIGAERWVRGLSRMSAAGLLELYRSTAVFVIPSHQEGLCVAGIEAMACGCPVVTTACGGPEDYVIDGQNGYVTAIDTRAVAERVMQILRSREERQRLSVAARETAAARFSPELIEQRFMDIFRRVFPRP